jgi:hypothetical protein
MSQAAASERDPSPLLQIEEEEPPGLPLQVRSGSGRLPCSALLRALSSRALVRANRRLARSGSLRVLVLL